MNKKVIFIGDSHASFFSGQDRIQGEYPDVVPSVYKEFEGIRLGPVLAYSLNKPDTHSKGREKLFEILKSLDPEKHIIGLCFGEIDCRCHIIKQAYKQKISIAEAVTSCFNSYESVIDEITGKGFSVILWNAIPTSPSTLNNPEFPHFGTDEERKTATELFNAALAAKADNKNIHFLTIYNQLLKDNARIDHYFFDGVHLSQSAMYIMMRELNKITGFFSATTLQNARIRSIRIALEYRIARTKMYLKKSLRNMMTGKTSIRVT